MIIPVIDPRIEDSVEAGRETNNTRQTINSKVIVTDAACNGARVFRNPADVNQTDTDGMILRYGNTYIRSPMLTYPVLIDGGTTASRTRTGIH